MMNRLLWSAGREIGVAMQRAPSAAWDTANAGAGARGWRAALLALAFAFAGGSSWAITTPSVTLSSSLNPSGPSQSTTLTVVVTGTQPTGSIAYYDGANQIASSVLNPPTDTTATTRYNLNLTKVGPHTLTAVYSGDGGNAGGTSNAITQKVKVGTAATTTSLGVAPNPTYVNMWTTLTATVAGNAPAGSVNFYDGPALLGAGPISGGVATFQASFGAAGASHALKASFLGDTVNAPSDSQVVSENVNNPGPSTVQAAAQSNSVPIGPVVFTATVTGPISPTGYVTLTNGSNWLCSMGPLTSVSATASRGSCTASLDALGTYGNLVASYPGDSGNLPSTSHVPAVTVVPAPTSVLLLTGDPPRAPLGATVLMVVHLSSTGSTEGGAVNFMDGNTRLATVVASGEQAELPVNFTSAGPHNLSAIYGGTATTIGGTSPTVVETIDPADSPVVLTISPLGAAVGQSVTMTTHVTPASAKGTVSFSVWTQSGGTVAAGSSKLVGGVASLPWKLTDRVSYMTAQYSGDHPTATSDSVEYYSDVVSQSYVALAPPTSTISAKQNVVLRATVSGANYGAPPATGSVTFLDGGAPIGTAMLSGSIAQLETNFSAAGTHNLSAHYAGDAHFLASDSLVEQLTVNPLFSPTMTLSSSATSATVGQTVRLTANMNAAFPMGGILTFMDGSAPIGSVTVRDYVPFIEATFSSAGSHTLTAQYAGDAVNNPATGGPITQTVVAGVTLPPPPASPAPVVDFEYDALGNPTRTVQAKSVPNYAFATRTDYDVLERPYLVTDARSGQTRVDYDGLDRAVKVIDLMVFATKTPRNGLGDVKSLASPDTGVASMTYDALGNLKTRTDSRGVLATYGYDALNRLKSLTYTQSGQPTLSYGWTYDEPGVFGTYNIGRLTSTQFPAGSSKYAYDAQGLLLQSVTTVNAAAGANASAINLEVDYVYDSGGNLTNLTYPSGRQVVVSYANGQPSAIYLAPNGWSLNREVPLLTDITRAPFGGALSWNWQLNGAYQQTHRVYDSSGRLVRYQLGQFIRDLSYDPAGRIVAYKHYDLATGTATAAAMALDQNFGYDELSRLTRVSYGTSAWGITYDANGNRTSVTLNGVQSVYTSAKNSNWLNSMTNPARNFTHDAAGNTTSDSTVYSNASYDLANRLETLTNWSLTETFAYDAAGLRVRKSSSSGAASTVLFAYDQDGHLLGEYDKSGTALREYVWFGSTPVAMFTPDPAGATNPPLVYYIHADHLDAPRVVVDRDNNVRWRWMAEPFGTTAPETNPGGLGKFTMPLRFPGQYADSETGLSYNWLRDYDASIGRYAQSDPIGLQGGTNTYAYVRGSPLNFVDPDGLQMVIPAPAPAMSLAPWAAPAAAVGAAGYLGWEIGDWLNPYVQPAINDVASMCSHESNCAALRDGILQTCASLTGSKRARCVAAAQRSYVQCLQQK